MTEHQPSAALVPRRHGELVGIQYLRGLAVMMVVVFHLKSQFLRMGYTVRWLDGLSSGVDIFFVISGFIMLVTTANKPITPWTFWWRRIVRIVPLYWLVTGFMTAVMLIVPSALQTGAYDGWHLLASYLFIPAMHPVQHSMEPLVTPGWTLNYEMFFYLIFGLFLLTPRRMRFVGTMATLLLFVALGVLLSFPVKTVPGFYTSTIMLEFGFGMALGEIAVRSDFFGRVPRTIGWSLLIGGIILLIVPNGFPADTPRAFARGIFATVAVAGALIIEANGRVREVKLLHALGNASYSIYLTQIIVTSALSQYWRHLVLHKSLWGVVLFSAVDIALCAIAGWLCYRLIERNLNSLFRKAGLDGIRMRASALPPASAGTSDRERFLR